MTTDHPVEKLGTKVMNSLDWTVQAFVDARISTETLLQPDAVESILKVWDAKAGWIQEDESKLLLRNALFSVEKGMDESLRQYTTRRLAQIEAASAAALVTMPTTTWGTVLKESAKLTKQSELNLNTLFNGSTELDDVARALNMLDVESQEGIIKAAVKPVVHSFMETGKFSESQPCEEETDEPNDQSDEEEKELCPPLEETMAASWIAQIGEEDLSETEAVHSFCVGCAIVKGDHAPDCGVAQGVVHGVIGHHGKKQEEVEGELGQEVEGQEEENTQTPVRMTMTMDEMERHCEALEPM